MQVPCHKHCFPPLTLTSNSKAKIAEDTRREKFSERITGTENESFNALFTIRSESEQNIYYMLTPDTMEKLAAAYQKAMGSFASNAVCVCMVRNELYLGIREISLDFLKKNTGAASEQVQKAIEVLKEKLDIAISIANCD